MKTPNVFAQRLAHSMALVALVLPACGGPQTALKIQGTLPGGLRSAKLRAAGPVAIPVKNRDGSGVGTVTLDDARVVIAEIEFRLKGASAAPAGGEANPNVKITGPYVVNLLTSEVTPPLPPMSIDAGEYEQILVKLDLINGSNPNEDHSDLVAPTDPLWGHSLYMKGKYTGATAAGAVTDAPFELTNDFDETLELLDENSRTFMVADGVTNPIILAFRLAAWFDFSNAALNSGNLNFSDVEVASGSVLLHDNGTSSVNANIGDLIRKIIKQTVDCGRDEDSDGVLDSEEDDDPANEDAMDD